MLNCRHLILTTFFVDLSSSFLLVQCPAYLLQCVVHAAPSEAAGSEAPAPSTKPEEPASEPASFEAASAVSVRDSSSELQSGSPAKHSEEPLKEASSSPI